MPRTSKHATPAPAIRTNARNAELRRMLTERRAELQAEVNTGIRSGRAGRPKEGGDTLEDSDAMVQGDIAISLLQMRAEMSTRIEQAIHRLDAGRYGTCVECDDEISEKRLRALPFAVRCQSCEGAREQVQGHAQRLALQKGSFWLLSDKQGA